MSSTFCPTAITPSVSLATAPAGSVALFVFFLLIAELIVSTLTHPSLSLRRRCEKAYELDVLQGNDRWKRDASSRFYDHVGLQARLAALKDARRGGLVTPPSGRSRVRQDLAMTGGRSTTPMDWEDRLAVLRENMDRNICGIAEPWLYNYATIGSKKLIEDYVTELALQIERDCMDVDVRLAPDPF